MKTKMEPEDHLKMSLKVEERALINDTPALRAFGSLSPSLSHASSSSEEDDSEDLCIHTKRSSKQSSVKDGANRNTLQSIHNIEDEVAGDPELEMSSTLNDKMVERLRIQIQRRDS